MSNIEENGGDINADPSLNRNKKKNDDKRVQMASHSELTQKDKDNGDNQNDECQGGGEGNDDTLDDLL
eukprot:CAMPEP_0201581156 /NCGR_PEP_ID=MMETSP0190_2-20130828/63821_1 /ASSEMBLY_ACC=CAM_ASM_000263 /TAXON_ID=37353 /ORGANISM="Rosalina sp." /LENGTH=67 /DNA_ID=CAMNT_0048018533 /DNA_START=476 /DNA_END=679 /DNA_ORIENTATION=-